MCLYNYRAKQKIRKDDSYRNIAAHWYVICFMYWRPWQSRVQIPARESDFSSQIWMWIYTAPSYKVDIWTPSIGVCTYRNRAGIMKVWMGLKRECSSQAVSPQNHTAKRPRTLLLIYIKYWSYHRQLYCENARPKTTFKPEEATFI